MSVLGLEWDSSSARLDARTVMEKMIRDSEAGNIEGTHHFQILADGVTCYRHMSVCNVGIKLFNSSPNFNSLTSMKML